ncbi:cache domain-containing protein [uncultured Thermanaerothrix sp.]|uniref:cache domain-containing protein n=1 Tax=uncultured Thermanaerothrix sp. TaxID=1195149 RepID=UPI00263155AA|nr:cache domain-containing protein [uncultured Thermanaerothrix sp.]
MRILLVQNDLRACEGLVRYLRNRGHQVELSTQPNDIRTQCAALNPDLVFLDLHYPGEVWLELLRFLRQEHPQVRLILTSRHPDLQREMQARAYGVNNFLRQPFTPRWIEAALRRAEGVGAATQPSARLPQTQGQARVRIPVRLKIIFPYLILGVFFTLAAAYVVTRVVFESVQERFLNQLLGTAQQAQNWLANEEDRLLATLRLVANTEGVATALEVNDAETLRLRVLPLAINSNEEIVALINPQGLATLVLYRSAESPPGVYQAVREDPAFQSADFVQKVLAGVVDTQGDKFAGRLLTPWGHYFFVSGPVFNTENQRVGVVVVGKSIASLAREMREDLFGEATFYDFNGQPLSTTLYNATPSLLLPTDQVAQVLGYQDQQSLSRTLTLGSLTYGELLRPWEARGGEDLGILGIALPQTFVLRTSQATRLQVFSLVVAAILLVVLIGVYLANRITRPLAQLVQASAQVAQGNLEIKVNLPGNDELTVLGHAFNAMIAGLQEGSIYRDLLGRTVSPEVREQLRQTFASGNLRLEGQEAIATVLMTDIRGFTTLSEQVEPARVLAWLNEYFDRLVPIIVAEGGVVNKFDGDALLAFFGILPRILSPKKSALAACRAAVRMLEALEALNRERTERGDPPLITGIGINTGMVIAGGLGARDRLHYTIIGDTVNTTQRIEALTRSLIQGSGALISHTTYTALGEHAQVFNLQPLGLQRVPGKQEPLEVYRLLPRPSAAEVPALTL